MSTTCLFVLLTMIMTINTFNPVYGHGTIDQNFPPNSLTIPPNMVCGADPPGKGQQFVATNTSVIGADVFLQENGSWPANTVENYIVNIRTNNINGSILGTTSISPQHTGGNNIQTIHVDFPQPIMTTPGNTYFLELSSTSPPTRGTIFNWMCDNSNLYPNGVAMIQDATYPATADFAFRTYTDSLCSIPDAPTSLTTTVDGNDVFLSWTAPPDDGGCQIIDYIVQYKPNTSSTWIVFNDGVGTLTTAVVPGLDSNTVYDFRVAAANSTGVGPYSNTASATTGGCLIATATYGTEMAPQVQMLREIRDNALLETNSGLFFMNGFNSVYYTFSPTIAQWENENPMFKEIVKTFITPMISTLSIMTLVEDGSEIEVLGFGISVIALNLGMYIAAPAVIGFKISKHFKSKK